MANLKARKPELFANIGIHMLNIRTHGYIITKHKLFAEQYIMKIIDKTLFQMRIFKGFKVRILRIQAIFLLYYIVIFFGLCYLQHSTPMDQSETPNQ